MNTNRTHLATGSSTVWSRSIACALVAALALAAIATAANAHTPRDPRPTRQIDLAICLDTSGSMSGLIESAKQKLWAIVNDLALAKPTPELRVSLLTFGNDGNSVRSGWVNLETPFTHDLDLVSRRLFRLSTNGGTEYVGRALHHAGSLRWSKNRNALKIVVVAGNESADQDRETPFRAMCRDLVARDIIVNSIYCGPAEDDIAPSWRDVALLGLGQFASIDHDHGTVVIRSPFDDRLGLLSSALNDTYVPFGVEGRLGFANQQEQDSNAALLNSAAKAARAQTKASPLYRNSWDLVEEVKNGKMALKDVKREDMPAEMQEMDTKEQEAYLAEMDKKRQDLQKQIAELAVQRDEFVQEEMKRQGLDESDSFDAAIRQAIRKQASAKGFEFKEGDMSEAPGENSGGKS